MDSLKRFFFKYENFKIQQRLGEDRIMDSLTRLGEDRIVDYLKRFFFQIRKFFFT